MTEALIRYWAVDHHTTTKICWDATPWSRFIYAPFGLLKVRGTSTEWTLPQTHGFWVSPHASYEVTCVGKVSLRTVYLHPSIAPNLRDGVRSVSPFLRELLLEADRLAPLFEVDPISAALAALIVHHIQTAPAVQTDLPLPSDPLALCLASACLASPQASLEELVSQIPHSRRSLERKFREETGLSLGRWRTRARLIESVRVLSEGQTVSEASWSVGYQSPSAFIHAFRSHFGESPGRMERREPA